MRQTCFIILWTFFTSDWQIEFTDMYLNSKENIICFLPTGGGKTLVSQLALLNELLNIKLNVLLVLPYVALAKEKIRKFTPFALDYNFLIEEYAGGKGVIPPKKRVKQKSLYIGTIEKSSMLIHSLIETNRLSEIGLVIFDEVILNSIVILPSYYYMCNSKGNFSGLGRHCAQVARRCDLCDAMCDLYIWL